MKYSDMSSGQRLRQSRIYLTMVVATSHFFLMLLGVFGRLSYSVPSRYVFLLQTLTNPLWVILHGVCFLALIIALYKNKGQVTALGAATGVMGSWAFLDLLWGLTTLTPVSLPGPILAGAIATLSYLLTNSWARLPRVQERGE